MNADKCSVLRFQRGNFDWKLLGILGWYYIDNMRISFEDHQRDLGVTVDVNLKFHRHI